MIRNQTATSGSAVMPKTLIEEAARGIVLLLVGLVWPALIHLIPTDAALGPILMPLMLPIALAAFLLPFRSALAVACVMPFLSMSMTGMPPLPTALQLAAEGAVFVALAQVIISAKKPRWLAIAVGALACRLGAWLISVTAFQASPLSAALLVSQGLIGLILAGLILPILMKAFGKSED